MSNRTNANLRPSDLLKAGQIDQRSVNSVDNDAENDPIARAKRRESITAERNAVVARWLDQALRHHPKAGAVARECGITDAYLSQMRSGERTVPFHVVLSLLKVVPAAMSLIESMSKEAGLPGPRPPRRLTKKQAEKKVAARVRKLAGVWDLVRRDIAVEYGVDEASLEFALDEPTGEIRFDDAAVGA